MADRPEVAMICATSVMKPGRARIGRISKDITLSRTIPLVNLFAMGIGFAVGVTTAISLGGGLQPILFGAALGVGGGWASVTYSPLKNESLLKWVELRLKSQTRTRYINGRRVTLAVGTAIASGPSTGAVRLLRSSVRVAAGQYDERGAVRSLANRNIDPAVVGSVLGSVLAPDLGAVPLPSDAPASTLGRGERRRTGRTPVAPTPSSVPSPPVLAGSGTVRSGFEPDVLAGPTRTLKD